MGIDDEYSRNLGMGRGVGREDGLRRRGEEGSSSRRRVSGAEKAFDLRVAREIEDDVFHVAHVEIEVSRHLVEHLRGVARRFVFDRPRIEDRTEHAEGHDRQENDREERELELRPNTSHWLPRTVGCRVITVSARFKESGCY